MKRVLAATALLLGALLFSGCDAVAQYSVDNRTSEPLITWPSWTDCNSPSAPAEFHEPIEVSPQTVSQFESVYGGWVTAPKCVVVANTDNVPVLLATYAEDETYTVEEPVQELGNALPERGGQTADYTFVDRIEDGDLVSIGVLTVVLMMLAIPTFFIGRWAWRGANRPARLK